MKDKHRSKYKSNYFLECDKYTYNMRLLTVLLTYFCNDKKYISIIKNRKCYRKMEV